jgi:hypothetical protein
VPSASTRQYLALADRDGWECAYCHCPLIPLNGTTGKTWHSGEYRAVCPNGEHLNSSQAAPCWHEGYWTAEPGYEWPQVDHVIPRSRGGSNDLGNLALACLPCNARKGARLLGELPVDWWMRRTPPSTRQSCNSESELQA